MDSARGAAPATCSGSSSPSSSPGSASRSSSMRSARSSESGDSYSDDNEFRRPDSPSPSLGFGQRAAPQNAAPPLPSAGMGATASTLRPAAPRRISFGERSMYDALDALPGLPATTAAGVQSSSGGASASASHQGQLHPPWNYRAVRARIPSLEEIKKQAPSVAQPAPPTHAQDFLKAVRYLAAVLAAQEEQQEATAGGDGQGRSQREQVRARQRAEVRLTRKLLMIEAEAEGGDTVREEDADSVLGQLCSRMMDLDYVRNETVALIQGSDEKGYEEKVVALASCLRRASQRRQQGSAMSLMNSVLGGDLKSMWDDRKRAMDMEEVKAASEIDQGVERRLLTHTKLDRNQVEDVMDHWRNEFISTKEKARRMARRIRPYLSADENGDLVSRKRMGPRFKVEMEQGLLGRDNGVTILGRFQTGKRAKDADELLDRVRSTCRVDVSAVMRYRATIMKQVRSGTRNLDQRAFSMLNALSHRRLKEVLQEELKNKWQERRQAALEALRNKEQEAASRAGNEAGGAQATKRQALPLTSATIGRQLELCVHTGLIGNTRHQHAALRSIARSRHMSWLVQKGSIAGGASAEDVPKIVAKQEDQIQKRLSRPFLPPGWQRELIVDPKEAQAQQDAAVASLKSMERALKNVSGDLTATLARHLTTAAIIICEGLRTGRQLEWTTLLRTLGEDLRADFARHELDNEEHSRETTADSDPLGIPGSSFDPLMGMGGDPTRAHAWKPPLVGEDMGATPGMVDVVFKLVDGSRGRLKRGDAFVGGDERLWKVLRLFGAADSESAEDERKYLRQKACALFFDILGPMHLPTGKTRESCPRCKVLAPFAQSRKEKSKR